MEDMEAGDLPVKTIDLTEFMRRQSRALEIMGRAWKKTLDQARVMERMALGFLHELSGEEQRAIEERYGLPPGLTDPPEDPTLQATLRRFYGDYMRQLQEMEEEEDEENLGRDL